MIDWIIIWSINWSHIKQIKDHVFDQSNQIKVTRQIARSNDKNQKFARNGNLRFLSFSQTPISFISFSNKNNSQTIPLPKSKFKFRICREGSYFVLFRHKVDSDICNKSVNQIFAQTFHSNKSLHFFSSQTRLFV